MKLSKKMLKVVGIAIELVYYHMNMNGLVFYVIL